MSLTLFNKTSNSVVGDVCQNLVLQTLGKVYIKSGRNSKLLDDLIESIAGSKIDEDYANKSLVYINSADELQGKLDESDGQFAFCSSTGVLYIWVKNQESWYPVIDILDTIGNHVKKTGDTMTGTLNFKNSQPFTVNSKKLIKNLNANYLNGYAGEDFAKKPVNETIKGNWTFNGNNVFNGTNTANGTWKFNKNVKHMGDIVTEGSIGTPTFSSGFSGQGWRLDGTTNMLTIDYLVVRKAMHVYEMVINEISATNGALWIANSSTVSSSTHVFYLDIYNTGLSTIEDLLKCLGTNSEVYIIPSHYYVSGVLTSNFDEYLITDNYQDYTKLKETRNGCVHLSENSYNTYKVPKYILKFKGLRDLNQSIPLQYLLDEESFKQRTVSYAINTSDSATTETVPTITTKWTEYFTDNSVSESDLCTYWSTYKSSVMCYPLFSRYISRGDTASWETELDIMNIYHDEAPSNDKWTKIDEYGGEFYRVLTYFKYFAMTPEEYSAIIETSSTNYNTNVSNNASVGSSILGSRLLIEVPNIYIVGTDEDLYPLLKSGDICRCLKFDGENIKYYDALVLEKIDSRAYIVLKAASVFDKYTEVAYDDDGNEISSTTKLNTTMYLKSYEDYNAKTGEEGTIPDDEEELLGEITENDDLILMGNLDVSKDRSNAIYMSSTDDGGPYINILSNLDVPDYSVVRYEPVVTETVNNNVTTYSVTRKPVITTKVRLGKLDGIKDPNLPDDKLPTGFGLYGSNVFLTGQFYLNNGKALESIDEDSIVLKLSKDLDSVISESSEIQLLKDNLSLCVKGGVLYLNMFLNAGLGEDIQTTDTLECLRHYESDGVMYYRYGEYSSTTSVSNWHTWDKTNSLESVPAYDISGNIGYAFSDTGDNKFSTSRGVILVNDENMMIPQLNNIYQNFYFDLNETSSNIHKIQPNTWYTLSCYVLHLATDYKIDDSTFYNLYASSEIEGIDGDTDGQLSLENDCRLFMKYDDGVSVIDNYYGSILVNGEGEFSKLYSTNTRYSLSSNNVGIRAIGAWKPLMISFKTKREWGVTTDYIIRSTSSGLGYTSDEHTLLSFGSANSSYFGGVNIYLRGNPSELNDNNDYDAKRTHKYTIKWTNEVKLDKIIRSNNGCYYKDANAGFEELTFTETFDDSGVAQYECPAGAGYHFHFSPVSSDTLLNSAISGKYIWVVDDEMDMTPYKNTLVSIGFKVQWVSEDIAEIKAGYDADLTGTCIVTRMMLNLGDFAAPWTTESDESKIDSSLSADPDYIKIGPTKSTIYMDGKTSAIDIHADTVKITSYTNDNELLSLSDTSSKFPGLVTAKGYIHGLGKIMPYGRTSLNGGGQYAYTLGTSAYYNSKEWEGDFYDLTECGESWVILPCPTDNPFRELYLLWGGDNTLKGKIISSGSTSSNGLPNYDYSKGLYASVLYETYNRSNLYDLITTSKFYDGTVNPFNDASIYNGTTSTSKPSQWYQSDMQYYAINNGEDVNTTTYVTYNKYGTTLVLGNIRLTPGAILHIMSVPIGTDYNWSIIGCSGPYYMETLNLYGKGLNGVTYELSGVTTDSSSTILIVGGKVSQYHIRPWDKSNGGGLYYSL